MVFQRKRHKLNPRVLNSIADDLIEIKSNAANKNAFRNDLIAARLNLINQSRLLDRKAIDKMVKSLSDESINPNKLKRALKLINSQLRQHYKYLLSIFNKLS